MANKKNELTREDFQAAIQQLQIINRWIAEMAAGNEAPICIVTVNSEGKSFLHVSPYFSQRLNKVSRVLGTLEGQLKFMRPQLPSGMKPN